MFLGTPLPAFYISMTWHKTTTCTIMFIETPCICVLYSHYYWNILYMSFIISCLWRHPVLYTSFVILMFFGTPCIWVLYSHVYWETLYLSFPILEVRISLVSVRLCLYCNNNCEHSDKKKGKQHRYTEKELLVLQHAAPRLGLEQ